MKRILKSQLESGTPFMFYRDEVNRANSNIQSGLIYCSNLCTEITQNQSLTEFLEEYVEEDQTIVKKYKSGDYVVCNLSFINFGRAVRDDVVDRYIHIYLSKILHFNEIS